MQCSVPKLQYSIVSYKGRGYSILLRLSVYFDEPALCVIRLISIHYTKATSKVAASTVGRKKFRKSIIAVSEPFASKLILIYIEEDREN